MDLQHKIRCALHPSVFERNKQELAKRIISAIPELTVTRLMAKWDDGEKEHGVLNEEKLQAMDIERLFREEIEDAFWYHTLLSLQWPKPTAAAPRAYSAGILQLDGDDLPDSAQQGDLFICLKDTPENRKLQADLLRTDGTSA